MLFLIFHAGDEQYAIDAAAISEVLPLLHIRPIPQAPAGVAGVLDLRGTPVPVIDLSLLLSGRPAAARLSTRLIVIAYPTPSGAARPLALLAEKVTDTIRRAPDSFVDSGVANPRAAYLGRVATDTRGLVQRIEVGQLLPPFVRDVLFH